MAVDFFPDLQYHEDTEYHQKTGTKAWIVLHPSLLVSCPLTTFSVNCLYSLINDTKNRLGLRLIVLRFRQISLVLSFTSFPPSFPHGKSSEQPVRYWQHGSLLLPKEIWERTDPIFLLLVSTSSVVRTENSSFRVTPSIEPTYRIIKYMKFSIAIYS